MNVQTVKWYQSLGFKGTSVLVVIALIMVVSVIIVINTKGQQLVREESDRLIEQIGNHAITDLQSQSREIATLVRSLGSVTEQLPKEESNFFRTIPSIINSQNDDAIAGGGVWPEPYAFSPTVERRSFFWGREPDGSFKFYNDYNLPGAGYHHEEWYPVVRYINPGQCFWSKSYMDPYSYQPMVTCTVATYDQKKFSGTVTIDLKLEGLHAFTESWRKKTGGYVFITDRNNKFITFPEPALVKKFGLDEKKNQTEEFISVSELAQKEILFSPIASALEKMNRSILSLASSMDNYQPDLVEKIDKDSYQIDKEEARFLAAMIADPLKRHSSDSYLFEKLEIIEDFYIQKQSLVFIFHVPDSYWKLVIVKPLAKATGTTSSLAETLIVYLGIIILIIIAISYYLLHKFLILPLENNTFAVQKMVELIQEEKFYELENHEIKKIASNEIGLLSQLFNLLAARFVIVHGRLQRSTEVIKEQNLTLEQKVEERTSELEESNKELENQNTSLSASNQKLKDLNDTKKNLLQQISHLHGKNIVSLKHIHNELENSDSDKVVLRDFDKEISEMDSILQPITSLYYSEKAITSKWVLLAETSKKQQILAKMALGGTGMELDIASSIEMGKEFLSNRKYDIICANAELMELAVLAHQENEEVRSVFMTSDDASEYLKTLRKHSFISNIVSRHEEDRHFTLKNITTTISKLTTQDLFGLEKYLNWGVDIHTHPVTCSQTRGKLVEEMESYFQKLGIRRPIISKCAMVAEELLMNAIYDAPTNSDGEVLYNHLSREIAIELKPEEQGVFRYACDGILLAVSVEDPFGGLDRQTILDYLESCYEGNAGELNQEKGGAGRGLFQIIEVSDLVVINVRPGLKTEVISIFNLDPNKHKEGKTTSFHYFGG